MAWVWVNSRCWWWTGRPGMLQSMESPRVNMTEQLNSTELEHKSIHQDDIVIGKLDCDPKATYSRTFFTDIAYFYTGLAKVLFFFNSSLNGFSST